MATTYYWCGESNHSIGKKGTICRKCGKVKNIIFKGNISIDKNNIEARKLAAEEKINKENNANKDENITPVPKTNADTTDANENPEKDTSTKDECIVNNQKQSENADNNDGRKKTHKSLSSLVNQNQEESSVNESKDQEEKSLDTDKRIDSDKNKDNLTVKAPNQTQNSVNNRSAAKVDQKDKSNNESNHNNIASNTIRAKFKNDTTVVSEEEIDFNNDGYYNDVINDPPPSPDKFSVKNFLKCTGILLTFIILEIYFVYFLWW